MNSEDTPGILAMGSSFFSEAWWATSVLDWEIELFDPLPTMHGWDGLFWSSDQIVVFVFSVAWNLIKLVIEIAELACFGHDFFFHEERRLNEIIASLIQEIDSVVYQSIVEKNSHSLKEVSSVANDFLSSFGIITSQSLQNFMMVEASSLISNFNVRFFSPSPNDLILVFIVADGNWIMDNISDWVDKLIDFAK